MLLEAPEPSQLQEGEWKHLSRRGSLATLAAAQPEIINELTGVRIAERASQRISGIPDLNVEKSSLLFLLFIYLLMMFVLTSSSSLHETVSSFVCSSTDELLETHTKQSVVWHGMCTACTLSQES